MAVRRYNEPFFWHRIVNVGWATGAAVIVQVTAPEIKFYQVVVLDPAEWFDDIFGGAVITENDYREGFVFQLGAPVGTGETVVVEDELTDVWIWDGFLHGTIGDDLSDEIAAGTAAFGYAPNLHLTGQQVKRNRQNPAFGPYLIGEVVTHTHPSGTQTIYRSGYIALNEGPQYDSENQPFGHVSYASTDAYYWYRVTTRPGSTAAILRKSFLVNFRKDFARLAELQDFAMTLDQPLNWSIRGYPAGTSFNIASAIATPVGAVAARYSASGSVAGAHSGSIRKFNANGFVS